jgi:hypothetical protein
MSSSFSRSLLCLAIGLAATAAHAGNDNTLLRFSGAIGVDPLTSGGAGVDVSNVVRGIPPGGRAWILRKLRATVNTDGTISVRGKGLLFSSGDVIATRGGVANVAATLTCGAADATAEQFTTGAIPLDTAGDFSFRGPLLAADRVNTAVLPNPCLNPQLLIRNFNATTGVPGGWFAVGILGDNDD